MDISLERESRAPAIIAAVGLLVICSSLIFLTWSNVRQQRQLLERNMVLSAGVILRGVERGLYRILRQQDINPSRFDSRAGDLFQDLVATGNVRYLGLLTPKGTVLLSSDRETSSFVLSTDVIELIESKGSWSGMVQLGDEELLVLGVRSRPALAELGGHAFGPGIKDFEKIYLVIALGVSDYMVQYRDFRRAAVAQTGFIVAAAVFLLGLTFAFLRRREQGVKYAALQRFHSKLLDTMPDGLLSVDHDGAIRAANPAAHAILNRPQGDLIGEDWTDLGLATGKPNGSGGSDWSNVEIDGKKLEVLSRAIGDPAQAERLILIRDRTVQKSLEDRLAAAERLAAVGRMAAGVAHEIRNPLSSLRGFAQFFTTTLAGKQPEEEYARTMVREADRLNKVVSDMLFLAKPHPRQSISVDLPALGRDLSRLLALDLEQKHITLTTDFKADHLSADPEMLKQALLNLLVNSLAALPPSGGTITIASEPTPGGVSVSVSDNGSGMSPEERSRALEPFFTAKPNGTGLGLAIVDSILREHQGRIDIQSQQGHGTTVRLIFPGKE